VLWDLYNEFPEMQAEWDDFKVIGFRANCDVPITSGKEKVETLSDLKGWNIRGVSGPPNDFITAIGASPVNVPVADVYSALQNSTLDATMSDWHAVLSFRMYEAAKYYADEQITVNSFYFIMNKDSYNNLPADLQAVIDECSGQAMVDLDIDIFDRVEEEAKALIKDNGGEIYNLSPETRAEMQAIADQVVVNWIETQTAAGYPAQEIYDRMLELIDEWK
jgi:TRAP-type C4-dicarboxylate transport system substrate-binding protein